VSSQIWLSVAHEDLSHVDPTLEGNSIGQVNGWENLLGNASQGVWGVHLRHLVHAENDSIVIHVGCDEENIDENAKHCVQDHTNVEEENFEFVLSGEIFLDNTSGDTTGKSENNSKEDVDHEDPISLSCLLVIVDQSVKDTLAVEVGGATEGSVDSGLTDSLVSMLDFIQKFKSWTTWLGHESDLKGGIIDNSSLDSVVEFRFSKVVVLVTPSSEKELFSSLVNWDDNTLKSSSVSWRESGILSSNRGTSDQKGGDWDEEISNIEGIIFPVPSTPANHEVNSPDKNAQSIGARSSNEFHILEPIDSRFDSETEDPDKWTQNTDLEGSENPSF
jgi:hypothetical protein